MSQAQLPLSLFKRTGFPLLYLGAIIAAELITSLVSLEGGIAFHIIIMLLLILHSSLKGKHPSHKLYLALSLAPLIRILSLSMPLTHFSQILWYLIIALPLMGAAFLAIKRLGFKPQELGLNWGKIYLQLLIGSSGFLFGFLEYWILKPEPLIRSLTLDQMLPASIIFLIATGFAEEITFRGVMQRSAMEALGWWGWIYIAFLFAMLHIGYLSGLDLLFVLSIGLFFGWVVLKTNSLLGVSLSHGITNIVLYLVLPFLF